MSLCDRSRFTSESNHKSPPSNICITKSLFTKVEKLLLSLFFDYRFKLNIIQITDL